MVVLTVIAAAARGIGMPRCERWRATNTGPPSCPAGSKLLTDSPTQREQTASTKREWRANSTRIAAASIKSGTT